MAESALCALPPSRNTNFNVNYGNSNNTYGADWCLRYRLHYLDSKPPSMSLVCKILNTK